MMRFFKRRSPPAKPLPESAAITPSTLTPAEPSAIPVLPASPAGPTVVIESSRRWVGWAIGGIVTVALLGGGYLAYSRGYLKKLGLGPHPNQTVENSSTTPLTSVHKNVAVKNPDQVTAAEYEQARQRLQAIKDLTAISSEADLKILAVARQGNDTDDSRHMIQLLRLTVLRQGLISYLHLHGAFPESLVVLNNSWPAILDYCQNHTEECAAIANLRPVSLITADIYTDRDYRYIASGGDFTLKFFLSACDSSRYCAGDDQLYVVGTNTMTYGDLSREKPGLSDTIGPDTNAAVVAPANTPVSNTPSETINSTIPTNSTTTVTSLDGRPVAEQYALATCYINAHPDVLDGIPKNVLNDTLKDYVQANPKDMDCDKYTPTDIEAARLLLTTDADGDGVVLINERHFGSSDANKDTDGDSYDDLTEILNHYNPNGPGTL